MTTCQVTHLTSIFDGKRNASTNILTVLKTNQARNRMMHILGSNRRPDIIQSQSSIGLVMERAGLNSTQGCHSTCLVQIDVRLVPNNHLMSTLTVNQERG